MPIQSTTSTTTTRRVGAGPVDESSSTRTYTSTRTTSSNNTSSPTFAYFQRPAPSINRTTYTTTRAVSPPVIKRTYNVSSTTRKVEDDMDDWVSSRPGTTTTYRTVTEREPTRVVTTERTTRTYKF